MFFFKYAIRGKKNRTQERIKKQTEENIKELEEIGIHYVSSEEYHNNDGKYPYAMGILPKHQK